MSETKTQLSKAEGGLRWLGKQSLLGARDGCIALAAMTAMTYSATDSLTPDMLRPLAAAWDITLADHEALLRVAFFGGAIISAAQTAVGFAGLSLVARLLIAAGKILFRAHVRPVMEARDGGR